MQFTKKKKVGFQIMSKISSAIKTNDNDGLEINRIQRNYHEEPQHIDVNEFKKVIESRRSIRRFLPDPIPEKIMLECLRLATLAPNSSSLQPWEFYWVKTLELKKVLAAYCMSQPAATTAAELIVCVARTDTWKRNSIELLEQMRRTASPSESTVTYYSKLLPMQLSTSAWWVPVKWVIYNLPGLFKPMMRFPVGKSDLKIWAIKSTSLACQNLMLSLRSHGFDSCPMEGFDEVRVKKLLNLPRGAHVAMVLAAGKRNIGGVYGPQIRLPIENFVFTI